MRSRFSERRNPLWFTKDGSLDFGWAILLASCCVGLGVFTANAVGWIRGPSIAAWSWFGAFTSMAFIAGAARDRAALIANSRVPGEVAQGIGMAQPEHTDERGELTQREAVNG